MYVICEKSISSDQKIYFNSLNMTQVHEDGNDGDGGSLVKAESGYMEGR